MRLVLSALSFALMAASPSAGVAQGPKSDRIYIRSRDGKSVSVREWIIKGSLADHRAVMIAMDFRDAPPVIDVGLVVAGKSWGKGRIDGTQFPNLNIRSLGLNQAGPHIQVTFDYGVTDGCDKPGNLQPQVTVDFTAEMVKVYRDRGHCSN